MDAVNLPADYAIDGLSLEAERRSKQLGIPYSYGQLVADTTREERERIVEDYRVAMKKAGRKGHYRVNSGGTLLQGVSLREVEEAIFQNMELDDA